MRFVSVSPQGDAVDSHEVHPLAPWGGARGDEVVLREIDVRALRGMTAHELYDWVQRLHLKLNVYAPQERESVMLPRGLS